MISKYGGILIESGPLASTGGKVWQASIDFFDFLVSTRVFTDSHPVRMLELGSGCGWLGLRLAKEYPTLSVVMTEQENFGALERLQHNIALNPDIRSASALALDWGDIPADVVEAPWDLVIGSELVYSYEGARLLPRVIKALLTGPSSVCYYAHSLNRFESVDECMLREFKDNELNIEVVLGSDALLLEPGHFTELFAELRLVVFRISN
jgi:hypothetical protein